MRVNGLIAQSAEKNKKKKQHEKGITQIKRLHGLRRHICCYLCNPIVKLLLLLLLCVFRGLCVESPLVFQTLDPHVVRAEDLAFFIGHPALQHGWAGL